MVSKRISRYVAVLVVLAAFWAAHVVRRWRRRDDDPVLLPVVMLLAGLGMMTMVGLRDPVRDTLAVVTFAGGVTGGLLLLLLVSEIDFESSRWRRAVILPLAVALGLAALLLLFGSGPGSSGVKVNLFGAQPVEAIRLLVVFSLAAYFGRRLELLRSLSEPATPERRWLRYFRMPRWKDVRPVLASMALVLLFFFFQKDLGPALVLTCVFLGMYGLGRGHGAFVATGRRRRRVAAVARDPHRHRRLDRPGRFLLRSGAKRRRHQRLLDLVVRVSRRHERHGGPASPQKGGRHPHCSSGWSRSSHPGATRRGTD